MKSTDIALIIFIAIVSIGISYFGMNALMGDPSDKVEKIEYINDISGVVVAPDDETFNATALNLNEDVYGGKCYNGQIYDDSTKLCISVEEYNRKMNQDTEPEAESTPETEPTEPTE